MSNNGKTDGATIPLPPRAQPPGPCHAQYIAACQQHERKWAELAGNDALGQIQRSLSAMRCDLSGVLDILLKQVAIPKEDVFAQLAKHRINEIKGIEARIVQLNRQRLAL